MKKAMSLILALLMFVSLFTACAAEPTTEAPSTEPSAPAVTDEPAVEEPADEPVEEPAEAPADEPVEEPAEEPAEEPVEVPADEPITISYPLTTEPVTFTVLANGNMASGYPQMENDANNILAVQEVSKKTGVNIEWDMPADTATTVSLMLVSEDYTDGLMGYSSFLGKSLDYCIEEEIIYDLTDILSTYCPNYWTVLNSDPSVYRDATTDNGNIGTMHKITDIRSECYLGYYVRTDVLESAGFSNENLPVTYGDLETILATGVESATNAPLYVEQLTLMAGYDINTGFVHNGDNDLFFAPTSENYKAYLGMMADWYAKDYVDRDFTSRISFFVDPGLFIGGEVVVFPSLFSFRKVFEGAGMDITSIPWPKLNEGDGRYQSGAVNDSRVNGDALMIFTACQQPELLAQWFDYAFSEEGAQLANFGVQGTTFDFDENGDYLYPLTPDVDLNLHIFSNFMPFLALTFREYIGETEETTQDRAKWNKDWSTDEHYAQGELTADESEQVSTVMTDINTYVQEYQLGVITGARSLDEWDSYVAAIESMGLADCEAAYQAAHDRYMAR